MESYEEIMRRLAAKPPLTRQGRVARVSVEERILESVKAGSIMSLREVTDACNQFGDDQTFVLGQGAVNAALFRMANKGTVREIIPRTADHPRLFRFAL